MNKICQKCNSELPADAPGGVCPSCLLSLGLDSASRSERQTRPQINHQTYSIEELSEHFPHFEIHELIGQGGMGAVYQATQLKLDRPVAIKVLSPHLGSDPTFTERFLREAKTLAKLSHPNVVNIYDFGQEQDIHYLVMELVEGVNLRDAILAKSIEPDQALHIVSQVCDALQFAHDSGVVHRDIKPENILIDGNGNIKIADFGLAKLLEPTAQEMTLTSTRQVLGTMKYMAPEQIESPDVVDHRADLYSLGVVFYELLTGELPIGRFALPSEKAQVSGQLDDVVMKTLEKEPDKRYQHASHIKSAVAETKTAENTSSPITAEVARPVGYAPIKSPHQTGPNSSSSVLATIITMVLLVVGMCFACMLIAVLFSFTSVRSPSVSNQPQPVESVQRLEENSEGVPSNLTTESNSSADASETHEEAFASESPADRPQLSYRVGVLGILMLVVLGAALIVLIIILMLAFRSKRRHY